MTFKYVYVTKNPIQWVCSITADIFSYFEIGRTELLRANGGSYRQMEKDGLFAVVVKAECTYHQPAYYDDLLTIRTIVRGVTPAKIEHEYHVLRDDHLLATGKVTLALVDRTGSVQRVPDTLVNEFNDTGQ